MKVNTPVNVTSGGDTSGNVTVKTKITKSSKIAITIGTVVVITVIGILIAVFSNSDGGSGAKRWTCDDCGKTWTGVSYHDSDWDSTLCEECAWDYWEPFPIDNYRKR